MHATQRLCNYTYYVAVAGIPALNKNSSLGIWNILFKHTANTWNEAEIEKKIMNIGTKKKTKDF
jgi:hypothetical protein